MDTNTTTRTIPNKCYVNVNDPAFTKFAATENENTVYLVVRFTLNMQNVDSVMIDLAIVTCSSTTGRYGIQGILLRKGGTAHVTYDFNPHEPMHAIYRVKNSNEMDKVINILTDPSNIQNGSVEFAFGIDIAPALAKHAKISEVIEAAFDMYRAVTIHDGGDNCENINIYTLENCLSMFAVHP